MSPTRPKYLSVTDTHLNCSGLQDVPPDIADAIRTWLHDHGLDENKILASHPVIRHPETRTVEWTEAVRTGVYVQRYMTVLGEVAPFPQLLLEQRRPAACSSCGHERAEVKSCRWVECDQDDPHVHESSVTWTNPEDPQAGTLEVHVSDRGLVELSEAALAQLLLSAGWERA